MRKLNLLSLWTGRDGLSSARNTGTPLGAAGLQIDEPESGDVSLALRVSEAGVPAAAPLEDRRQNPRGKRKKRNRNGAPLALLRCQGPVGSRQWYIVSLAEQVGLNGTTPALPVARLEPGDLLSVGTRQWLVTVLWTPEPGPAPASLAEKPCPVCGGPLGLAPVVQCVCGGRWTHLERPENPKS